MILKSDTPVAVRVAREQLAVKKLLATQWFAPTLDSEERLQFAKRIVKEIAPTVRGDET